MSTSEGNIDVQKVQIGSPAKMSNFEQIFQTMASIVLVLDEKGCVRFINDNGSRLLEYETFELVGNDWFSMCLAGGIREDRQGYFDNVIHRLSMNGPMANQMPWDAEHTKLGVTPISHENAVITKCGKTRIILWRNHPYYYANGTFEGVLCIGEDITDYRDTEKSLQIALAKHKALFECFPLGISVTDEKGQILENNRQAEKLLSKVRAEHDVTQYGTENWKILKPDGSLFPPTEYPSIQSLQSGQPVHRVEMGIINSDYSTTWVSASAAPMDQAGYGVVVTYHDITERKRLEDLLVTREQLREFAVRHTLEELTQFLLDQAKKLTQSTSGFICFLDPTNEALKMQTCTSHTMDDFTEGDLIHERSQAFLEACVADCIQLGKPIVQNELSSLEKDEEARGTKKWIQRQLLMPVLKGDSVIAVMTLVDKAFPYTDHDVEAVSQLSSLAWDIIGRKQAELALAEINLKLQEALVREQHLANTDELTGLNNRRRIVEIAAQEIIKAKRYQQPLSVLMFDLDHLKVVNDTYGHSEGDIIIQEIANVALEALRACDAIGRLGGDEFIVLLPMAHVDEARQVAERIRTKVLACGSRGGSNSVKISISVGITEYRPLEDDEMTAESLFCLADRAMYSAKGQGRNVVVVNG